MKQSLSRLLLATKNRGKLLELQSALQGLRLSLFSLSDLPEIPEPEENGLSFAQNARLKAEFYHAATGLTSLADDSGLEVDALEGQPGVRSARFAPTDEERVRKLVDLLSHLDPVLDRDKRTARFVCAMCLVGKEKVLEVEGIVEGQILAIPRGRNGFGYDPIFFYPPLGKTFAELTRQEKNRVSHRARALALMRSELSAMET